MSDVAIRVENLGKRYRIGARQQRYGRFTETAMDTLTAPFRRLSSIVHRLSSDGDHRPRTTDDTIWALKDVSFEVQRGEAVGIIGRNGAGKSTLLKVLSRITKPTTGRAEIHGRVGSLLEVGTGFHPELTGRENIYLNGAVLGMKRAEIEQFLDTAAKRYSSGMYVRLAFAVAAHLEPEILLVHDSLLQTALLRVAEEWPRLDRGYRRLTAQLRRDGWGVNCKRIRGLLRRLERWLADTRVSLRRGRGGGHSAGGGTLQRERAGEPFDFAQGGPGERVRD